MRKTKKAPDMIRVASVAIWAFWLIALLEIGAWVGLCVTGNNPSDFRSAYEAGVAAQEHQLWINTFHPIAHPFFGYVSENKTRYPHGVGFHTDVPLPFPKKPRDFVIGIFGGSVAEGLAGRIEDTHDFVRRVKASVPALRDRNVVVINFALGCMKQPQQFSIYAYYYDTVDLSVNLDGYNEISFNNTNFPVEYPCWYELLYVKSPEMRRLIDRAATLRKAQLFVSRLPLQVGILGWSHFYYLTWKATDYGVRRILASANAMLAKSVHDNRQVQDKTELEIFKLGARNWGKYERLQAELAHAGGKHAVFLLQPNLQSTTKPLTKDEVAQRDQTPRVRSESIKSGYQILRAELSALQKISTYSYDVDTWFAGQRARFYSDACCHIQGEGNDVIIENLISIIARMLKK